MDLTQNTNDCLRIRTRILPYDIPPLTVYSYVGDEASEDELAHSAGAEDSPPEIAKSYRFKVLQRTGALYKRGYLERSARQYKADRL